MNCCHVMLSAFLFLQEPASSSAFFSYVKYPGHRYIKVAAQILHIITIFFSHVAAGLFDLVDGL